MTTRTLIPHVLGTLSSDRPRAHRTTVYTAVDRTVVPVTGRSPGVKERRDVFTYPTAVDRLGAVEYVRVNTGPGPNGEGQSKYGWRVVGRMRPRNLMSLTDALRLVAGVR